MSTHIEDVKWYSGRNCIGIVLVRLVEPAKFKAYIGVGLGYDEDADAEAIKAHGSRFHDGAKLWPHIPSEAWAS